MLFLLYFLIFGTIFGLTHGQEFTFNGSFPDCSLFHKYSCQTTAKNEIDVIGDVTTVDECQSYCKRSPDCFYTFYTFHDQFSQDIESHKCIIFKKCSAFESCPKYSTCSSGPSTPNVGLCQSKCQTFSHGRYGGNELDNMIFLTTELFTLKTCQDLCKSKVGCHQFTLIKRSTPEKDVFQCILYSVQNLTRCCETQCVSGPPDISISDCITNPEIYETITKATSTEETLVTQKPKTGVGAINNLSTIASTVLTTESTDTEMPKSTIFSSTASPTSSSQSAQTTPLVFSSQNVQTTSITISSQDGQTATESIISQDMRPTLTTTSFQDTETTTLEESTTEFRSTTVESSTYTTELPPSTTSILNSNSTLAVGLESTTSSITEEDDQLPLCFGGKNSYHPLHYVISFDPEETMLHSVRLPEGYNGGISAYNGEYLMYCGGIGEEDRYSSLCHWLKLDATAKQWWIENPMKKKRAGACSMTLDNKTYVFGGTDGVESFESVESIGEERLEWIIDTIKLPDHVHGMCCTDNGTHMYLLGGIINEAESEKVYRLDVANGQWEQLANMTNPKSYAGCGLQGDTLVVTSGRVAKTSEMYNVSSNEWTRIDDTGDARYKSVIVTIDEKLTVIGGISLNNSKTVSSAEYFDETTSSFVFTEYSSLAEGRFDFTCTMVPKTILQSLK